MITSLLVANRGEIARRVFRSARAAGISTTAVFSDPDARSPHVADADRAVRLPGASSGQTYLDAGAIVAAALTAGADAVHPGYGFLAEDPAFARRVIAEGLTWVGPPPEAMEAMALKIEARKRASAAGVPVLPELDPGSVGAFPVLVKASAGGGGRGMRAVHAASDLDAAIESAQREAQAAFGDGTVFCEPLLTGARHIEVQVLADQAGTVWALTERDCSVQRRYAKVIEETPSPAVGPALRDRLLTAATALARAVGYVNAGTVEFLVGSVGSGQDEFYFLEFNTRLQVEHPVTECIHGIDLVALQLAIAEGRPLPAAPPTATGHAIEARLYAEDPADGFRPAAGPVHAFSVPDADATFGPPLVAGPPGPFIRLDAGVEPGSVVSSHYDAMLAKVIAWAPSRDVAARRLAAALAGTQIAGPATNRDLLVSVLRNAAFTGGGADTSLLDDYDLAALVPAEETCHAGAAAAAVAVAAANRRAATVAASIPGGWRNVPSQPQLTSFTGPRGRLDVRYRWTRTGITVVDVAGAASEPVPGDLNVVAFAPDQVTLEVTGVRHRFGVTRVGDQIWVSSALGSVRLTLLDRLPPPQRAAESGSLIAPMPGNVTRVAAAPGDLVAAGQPVLVIEAMKMEHTITAPAAGVLAELRVEPGQQVNAGDVLAIVVPEARRTSTVPEARKTAQPPDEPEAEMTDADQAVLVRTSSSGGLRTITLDSPHNANALSTGLLTQLRAALDVAMSDQGVRVIVLTGAGKVFCAGADLKEARTNPAGAPGLMTGVIELLWDGSKPVICRVNGAARAGGIGLVAACDIAVATDRASFAFSEVRIGVVPAVISVPCLRRMPSRAAAEYFLTGEVFGARRAAEIGLVTTAVAAGELNAEVARYAGMLLRGGPGALAGIKGVLRDVPAAGFASGLALMSELSGRYFGSEEAMEGMAAFAAKRDPSWVEPTRPLGEGDGADGSDGADGADGARA